MPGIQKLPKRHRLNRWRRAVWVAIILIVVFLVIAVPIARQQAVEDRARADLMLQEAQQQLTIP